MLYTIFGSSFVHAASLFFMGVWLWPRDVSLTMEHGALFSSALWLATTAYGITIEHVSMRIERITTVYLLGMTLICAAAQGALLPGSLASNLSSV
jgi:hypothetical protein